MCFFASMSFAQTNVSTTPTLDKEVKTCVPSKECAKKMGMTLEECKKVCAKSCKKTKVASAEMEKSELTKLVSEENVKKGKCDVSKCKKGKKTASTNAENAESNLTAVKNN